MKRTIVVVALLTGAALGFSLPAQAAAPSAKCMQARQSLANLQAAAASQSGATKTGLLLMIAGAKAGVDYQCGPG